MPNNDYILRSDAINALKVSAMLRNLDSVEDGPAHRYKRAAERIIAGVPAADVEPKRKTGRRVYKHRTQGHIFKETGVDVMTGEKRTVLVYTNLSGKYPHCLYCDALAADSFMDYCPHCGAKMLPEPPKGEENVEL